ncbi:hypothetical protein Tco_1144453 [Tanacetum coccineum]
MDNNLPNAPNWAFNPLPEYFMGPLPNPSLEAYQTRVQELTDEANVLRYEISEGREAQDFSPVIEALLIWIQYDGENCAVRSRTKEAGYAWIR